MKGIKGAHSYMGELKIGILCVHWGESDARLHVMSSSHAPGVKSYVIDRSVESIPFT